MKIFISWSGDLSRKVAARLSELIEDILPEAKTWFSDKDIDKGAGWLSVLYEQLKETNFGICCLTKENLNSPWILFECGAIAKGLPSGKICTLLIDLNIEDLLKSPLGIFQATHPIEGDMFKLFQTMNDLLSNKFNSDKLKSHFYKWWPDFENDLIELKNIHHPLAEPTKKPDPNKAIYEILEITRSIHSHTKNISELKNILDLFHTNKSGRYIVTHSGPDNSFGSGGTGLSGVSYSPQPPLVHSTVIKSGDRAIFQREKGDPLFPEVGTFTGKQSITTVDEGEDG